MNKQGYNINNIKHYLNKIIMLGAKVRKNTAID